jgi:hypothetical protein
MLLRREDYRELSEDYLRLAERESDPHLTRMLEAHALALSQFAARSYQISSARENF